MEVVAGMAAEVGMVVAGAVAVPGGAWVLD